ncbi:tRNA (5-methylaminomethyl-2-thiouridylate)-methyltransferase [Candidatus Endomicrobiellum trichonymphae]|nr:tRNA (5-methylaminomethyl-2-thiouridylate)-methyltransferase [Candidatus Endomicrobium trichonymphae]
METEMKILIGLSGGVDSAVAAYLLKKQGYEVTGTTMSIWDNFLPAPKTKVNDSCLGPENENIETAHKIADFLTIPLYVTDCSGEYKKVVLENFRNEYKEGRTPNPCIRCNAYIKFGILPAAVKKTGLSFDKFATGHYANIRFDSSTNMYKLYKAADLNKDQTYFLYRLTQKTLSETIFPLGIYTKEQVRNIAKKIGLPSAEKPDSQDFYCGDYNDILQFPANPGNIVDKNGRVLGKHNGIWNYTIGKRKGLGLLGGTKDPLYVINISAKQNMVTIGTKEDLYSSSLTAKKVSWCSILPPKKTIEATAKIRRQHKPEKAFIIPQEDSSVKVEFAQPQMSVTAGQSIVFYKDDTVLGGGVII